MVDIRVELPFVCHSENSHNRCFNIIQKLINNRRFTWRIHDNEVEFVVSINCETKNEIKPSKSVLEDAYKEYLSLHPDNTTLQDKLHAKECETSFCGETTICLSCQLNAEIYIDDNILIWPDMRRYSIEEIVEKNYCIPLLYDRLDEHLAPQIKQFALGVLLSALFAEGRLAEFYPSSYVLYLNGQIYENCQLIETGFDLFESAVIPKTNVDINECWNWINNNTCIGNRVEASPVYFTALTYLLKRYDYEALLSAVLGLESLFVAPKSKNISDQFSRNISTVFSSLGPDNLRKVYKLRSKFVHAGKEFSIADSFLSYCNEPTLDGSIEIAGAVLLESIRMMIKNQAVRFVFKETVSYELK